MTDPALRARRLPVTASVRIAAPPADVWAAIAAPGNLGPTHPYVRRNPVERWPGAGGAGPGASGVGARDRLEYYSGLRMTREVDAWHDGADGVLGYDLRIWHSRRAVSSVRWRVTAGGAGRSRLTITVWPYLLDDWPPVARHAGQALGVWPAMRWYLRSVVRGFKWWVETGQPVRRNQFGPHPLFSPAGAEPDPAP